MLELRDNDFKITVIMILKIYRKRKIYSLISLKLNKLIKQRLKSFVKVLNSSKEVQQALFQATQVLVHH